MKFGVINKMQKLYNFWFSGQEKYNKDNPYSSITGTLDYARKWAKMLLQYNTRHNRVYFQSENGRKVYQEDK